jgi:hypothetical protein
MKMRASTMALRLLGILAIGFCFSAPAVASPITLDFENQRDPMTGQVPDGYGGVHWHNIGGHPDYVGGYHTGIVSGSWTAFNFWGTPGAISQMEFNLYDGYFTGAWRDDMTLQVLGYKEGVQLYDTSWIVDSTGPTLLSLNYIGVDLVRFVTSGGLNAVGGGDGTYFVVDNLRLEVTQTPIPAALPLFATALGGFALVARRRKRTGA